MRKLEHGSIDRPDDGASTQQDERIRLQLDEKDHGPTEAQGTPLTPAVFITAVRGGSDSEVEAPGQVSIC